MILHANFKKSLGILFAKWKNDCTQGSVSQFLPTEPMQNTTYKSQHSILSSILFPYP